MTFRDERGEYCMQCKQDLLTGKAMTRNVASHHPVNDD
jgi:hypothetical protein